MKVTRSSANQCPQLSFEIVSIRHPILMRAAHSARATLGRRRHSSCSFSPAAQWATSRSHRATGGRIHPLPPITLKRSTRRSGGINLKSNTPHSGRRPPECGVFGTGGVAFQLEEGRQYIQKSSTAHQHSQTPGFSASSAAPSRDALFDDVFAP